MSILMAMTQSADVTAHAVTYAGMHIDTAMHAVLNLAQAADPASAAPLADGGHHGLVVLAQDTTTAAPPSAAQDYASKVQDISKNQEEQLGWLSTLGKHFIGVFQKGGEVFSGFVTGIIPTLVVLMTAFYAITEIVGEQRVHGLARSAGRIALTRYTVLPLIAVFFLTNPMAYTFGTFLDEKYKPAFYDSAVSFVHPILGLFPHANPGEYFVWGGVLVALMELEKAGKVPVGYHITVAIAYFLVGLVVILLKGMLTEKITLIMARRQGVKL